MLRVTDAGLTVYVIQGQHDYADPPWPKALCSDEVIYVDQQLFEPLPGLKIYGLDNRPLTQLEDAIKAVPLAANCLMLHQLARQIFKMDGAWDFDADWVPEHIKHMFIGDFHEQVDFPYGIKEHGRAWYTGSTYMCSITEEVNKSFLDVTFDDGSLTVKRIPLDTRFVTTVTLDTIDDLKAAIDSIAKAPKLDMKPIIIAEYSTGIPQAVPRLQAAAKAAGVHLWAKPTALRTDEEITYVNDDGTPIVSTEMVDLVDRYAEPSDELNAFLRDLLTKDIVTVFDMWRTKMGVAE